MQLEGAVGVLLAEACPSIRYRTRLEILSHSASNEEMVDLQRQILQDRTVKEVMRWRQPDGWLAWDFHGTKSLEAGIRVLCEKGVDSSHPVVAGALGALEARTDRLHRGIGKVGETLDELGFGGSLMMRAVVFAYAGDEEKPFVKEQVDAALGGFKAVQRVRSIDDLVERHRDKLIFRSNVKWPSIYHLRLVALARHWRTPGNLRMIAKSIQRLVDLSPIPDVYVRHKSRIMAPASFCMHDFTPDAESMDAAQWMRWFHRMELLSRLGVVRLVPKLKAQLDTLAEMVEAGGGRFTKRLTHPFFRKWGAYAGLMLEKDWRSPKRREFDLTFRSALILHFAGTERGTRELHEAP